MDSRTLRISNNHAMSGGVGRYQASAAQTFSLGAVSVRPFSLVAYNMFDEASVLLWGYVR